MLKGTAIISGYAEMINNGLVHLSNNKNEIILTVEDNGRGIPEPEKERIFERFYRVNKSSSRDSGGTGLGLSIVKHGVNLLGGNIELESKLGEGTLIKVRIPKI